MCIVMRGNASEPAYAGRAHRRWNTMTRIKPDDRGEVVLYRNENGRTALDVCLAGETMWLTLNQVAELYSGACHLDVAKRDIKRSARRPWRTALGFASWEDK